VLIGETYLPNTAELEKWYGGPKQDELQLPMDLLLGFHGNHDKLDAALFRAHIEEAETQLHGAQPLFVFDNHDNVRSVDRYGDGVHDEQIEKILASVLLTTRATALLYEGEEIGQSTTTPTRREDVKDPIGITGWPKEKGRDGERTPMQWDGSANAGFTSGTPWLPVPPNAAAINVKAEESDPNSLLAWYKALIRLKKTNAALKNGANVMMDPENMQVLSWIRQAQGAPQVLISVNFTAEPQTVDLAIGGAGIRARQLKTLLKTPGGTDPVALDRITLLPFGVYIGEVQ
jgi:alpha-glucosidase